MLLKLSALALLFSVHATALREREYSQIDITNDSQWTDIAQGNSKRKSLHSEQDSIKSARDALTTFLQETHINAHRTRKRRSKDSDQATYGFNVPAGDKLRISFSKPGEDNVPHHLQKELLLLQKEVMRQVSERDNVTSLVRMLLSKVDVLETRERDNTQKHTSEIKSLRNHTRKLYEQNENLSGKVDALRELNRNQNDRHEKEISMLREEKQKLWAYTQSLERNLNATEIMLVRNNQSLQARLINLETLNDEQHQSHSGLIENVQSNHASLLEKSQQFMVDTAAKMKNFEAVHETSERTVEKLEYLFNNKFKDISDKVDDLKLQDQRLIDKDIVLEDQTGVIERNVDKLLKFEEQISNKVLTVNTSLKELQSTVLREVDAIYSKQQAIHETQTVDLDTLKSRMQRVENKADDLEGIDSEVLNDINEIEEKLTNTLDKSSQVLETIEEHTVKLDVLKTSVDTLSGVFKSQREMVLAHYEHITGLNASLESYEKTIEMFKQRLTSASKKFLDLQLATEEHRTKFAEILSKVEDHGETSAGHQQNIEKIQTAVSGHQNIFTDMGKTLQNLNQTLNNALKDVTFADSSFSGFNDTFYKLLTNQIKLSNDFVSLQLKQQYLEANQDVAVQDFKFELASIVSNVSRNYLASAKAEQEVAECQQQQEEASNTIRYLGTTVQNMQTNVSAFDRVGTRLGNVEEQLLASIQNVSDNCNLLQRRMDESSSQTQTDIKHLNQTILSLTKIAEAEMSPLTTNEPAVNPRPIMQTTVHDGITESISKEEETPIEESEGEFVLPTMKTGFPQSTASAVSTTTRAPSRPSTNTNTKKYTETQKTLRPDTPPRDLPVVTHFENSTSSALVTLSSTSDLGDPDNEIQTTTEIRYSVTEDDLAELITMPPTSPHLTETNVSPPSTSSSQIINDTATLANTVTTEEVGSGDEEMKTPFPNTNFTEYLSWQNVTPASVNLSTTESTALLNVSAESKNVSSNVSTFTPGMPIIEETVLDKRTACPKRLATVSGSKVLTELRKIQGNDYSTGAWFKDSASGDDSLWAMPGHVGVDRVYHYESEIALRENMLPRDTFMLPIKCAGTGHVVFRNSVFCSLFKQPVIMKYNLTDGQLSKLPLSDAGVDNSYSYSIGGWTAIDFAVDEHGLWVIYSSVSRNGTMVIGKINEYSFSLENTWHTSQKKNTELNAFMICGILYTVSQKFLSPSVVAEAPYIHYTFSTSTGEERVYSPGDIQLSDLPYYTVMMDYNPSDEMLYSWKAVATNSQLLTYQLNFTSIVETLTDTHSIGNTTEAAGDS